MRGHIDVEQLKSMDYKNLQALAKDLGVSAGGKTEEIIARIAAVEVDVPEESTPTAEEMATATEDAALQAAKTVQHAGEKAAAEQEAEEREEAAQAAKEAEEKAVAEQKAGEEAEARMVSVKATTRFLDKQLNRIKDEGESYQVSRERAAELAAAGVAEIVG